jgi:hypothetical protein
MPSGRARAPVARCVRKLVSMLVTSMACDMQPCANLEPLTKETMAGGARASGRGVTRSAPHTRIQERIMIYSIPPFRCFGVSTAILTAALATGACASRTVETASPGEVAANPTVARDVQAVLASWPAKQRETATAIIGKYGEPSVVGDRMLVWFNTGPFVKTALMRDAVPHNFPMPHVDYLTQTVMHRVPADKLDDLHEYDGSVWAHRTRGELSAQCDVEAMNFLALNLAHDVIMGTRSAADARDFYAKTAMAFKQGDRSSAYVTGLMFQSEPNAADPDRQHGM